MIRKKEKEEKGVKKKCTWKITSIEMITIDIKMKINYNHLAIVKDVL